MGARGAQEGSTRSGRQQQPRQFGAGPATPGRRESNPKQGVGAAATTMSRQENRAGRGRSRKVHMKQPTTAARRAITRAGRHDVTCCAANSEWAAREATATTPPRPHQGPHQIRPERLDATPGKDRKHGGPMVSGPGIRTAAENAPQTAALATRAGRHRHLMGARRTAYGCGPPKEFRTPINTCSGQPGSRSPQDAVNGAVDGQVRPRGRRLNRVEQKTRSEGDNGKRINAVNGRESDRENARRQSDHNGPGARRGMLSNQPAECRRADRRQGRRKDPTRNQIRYDRTGATRHRKKRGSTPSRRPADRRSGHRRKASRRAPHWRP